MSPPEKIEVLLLVAPFLVLSLVLREYAKAWVATWLGDPTPRQEGHRTLHPEVHMDPIGLGAFILSYLIVGFPFGWARPVPLTPRRFRHVQRSMALVALAGVLTSLALAIVAELLLVHGWYPHTPVFESAVNGVFQVGIGLSLFNLIPVPPLDGSRIVGGFMRRDTWEKWVAFDEYGPVLLLVLFLVFRVDMSNIMQSGSQQLQTLIGRVVG